MRPEFNYSNLLEARESVSMPNSYILTLAIRPNRKFRTRRIRFCSEPIRTEKTIGGENVTYVTGRVMGRVKLHNFYRPEEKKALRYTGKLFVCRYDKVTGEFIETVPVS